MAENSTTSKATAIMVLMQYGKVHKMIIGCIKFNICGCPLKEVKIIKDDFFRRPSPLAILDQMPM
jgi:hypothetical protein